MRSVNNTFMNAFTQLTIRLTAADVYNYWPKIAAVEFRGVQ